jgi:hypothetical protein
VGAVPAVFKQFIARVGIPSAHSTEQQSIERAIGDAYPGMRVRFENAPKLLLIGVEAPDRQSAALVLPLLEKIISGAD